MKNGTLIIGNGEVGRALLEVLSKAHSPVYIKDVEELEMNDVMWLHICYPYSKNFVKITKAYIERYRPLYTIIHSSVPVGTTSAVGYNAYHSPIRGIHPNIADGILTFDKYIGGEYNSEVGDYFKRAGIKVVYVPKPETTELGKLLDTTYYGWNIVFQKEAEKICKKYGADFNVAYTAWNKSYNDGFIRLNKSNVVRPVLVPMWGKIGGHCVINNCKLLKEKVCKIILKFNKKY